jgi:hypothetical protein
VVSPQLATASLTQGVAEAIVANEGAAKPLVANIVSDHDIGKLPVDRPLNSFVHNMSRKGEFSVALSSLVTRLFV